MPIPPTSAPASSAVVRADDATPGAHHARPERWHWHVIGPRAPSFGAGTASTTRRATALHWPACCRGSLAARLRIVVVCSCRGGYSRQQCHDKSPAGARYAGHGAGPGRRMTRRLALERAKRARRRLGHPAAAGRLGHPSQEAKVVVAQMDPADEGPTRACDCAK